MLEAFNKESIAPSKADSRARDFSLSLQSNSFSSACCHNVDFDFRFSDLLPHLGSVLSGNASSAEE